LQQTGHGVLGIGTPHLAADDGGFKEEGCSISAHRRAARLVARLGACHVKRGAIKKLTYYVGHRGAKTWRRISISIVILSNKSKI
jgi:hypothetical protein